MPTFNYHFSKVTFRTSSIFLSTSYTIYIYPSSPIKFQLLTEFAEAPFGRMIS